MKNLLYTLLFVPLALFGQLRHNINDVVEIQNVRSGLYRYHLRGSLEPVTGIIYDYFNNGQLKTELEVMDGWLHGKSKVWHNNGQMHMIEIYNYEKLLSGTCWNEDGVKVLCILHGGIFENVAKSTFFIIVFVIVLSIGIILGKIYWK